ncbi:MAG TPA: hypothetical protein K8W04_00995 [Bacteroides reticulotermitis]|nr:hypothetical protein [Bacteroides reticulotermitis]
MKTINNLSFLLATFFLLCLSACHEQEDYDGEIQDGKLVLNYQVDGGMEVSTYAIVAGASECKIDDVYTLFFRTSSHSNANAYVGYTRTSVSTTTPEGKLSVVLPRNEKVDDAWQLLFLANFDANAFLDGEASIEDFLANKVATKTYEEARKYLMASFTEPEGLSAPLAMSAQATKAASTNVVRVNFKRRVARIDVDNSATANFELVSVQVWNARTRGYMFDEGGDYATDSDLCHYKDQVIRAIHGKIQGRLYAFPNFVNETEAGDEITTCLIIGGKYGGSSTTTYYRVNVCPAISQQLLKANGAYTINITKVNSVGEGNREDAYKSPLKMEYEINEWDDSFLGIYVFDKDGNGLGVSQRKVIFSEEGGQSVQLEVFTLKSTTKPITGSWAVSGLQGTNASTYFSAERNSVADNEKYIKVTTLLNNATLYNREATFDVTWGGLSIPISLTQLNPNSLVSKIILDPDELTYERPGATKEICVNLQGNFAGINRENITPAILYKGSNTDWLTLSQGTTSDIPALGLFYFNVTASANASGADRLADIKFVAAQGELIMTAQASVKQTFSVLFVRDLSIHMLEKLDDRYMNKGNPYDYFSKVLGFLPGYNGVGGNKLHFALKAPDQFKYEIKIKSSIAWKFVANNGTSSNLRFTPSEGVGDANAEMTIVVTVDSQAELDWEGGFYIEYADGDRTAFVVYQHGAFGRLFADNNVYYYGTYKINGKIWLDRNLGATVGQRTTEGYYTNQSDSSIPSVAAARGVFVPTGPFGIVPGNTTCPPGFRFPKQEAGSGELDWVYDNMKWSTSTGDYATGGILDRNVWYVRDSADPNNIWFIPICGNFNNPTYPQI